MQIRDAATRAVTLIPGTTEFGYEPATVVRVGGPGKSTPENRHVAYAPSDVVASLDELQALAPNLSSVSLVVGWFGNDLRCGQCQVKPGVDNVTKVTAPEAWRVCGTTRDSAHLVSWHDGGPAYGGTPSDASVIRAILELKSRGLKVMFHPFVLMDVAAGNARPDPYGGVEQAPYPWRGRITCSIAPGRAGSPDTTATCAAEASASSASYSTIGQSVTPRAAMASSTTV